MENRKDFEYKNAADRGSELYHLLFPAVASGDLVDPKWVVQLHPYESFHWLTIKAGLGSTQFPRNDDWTQ